MNPNQFLEAIGPAAQSVCKQTGIPASITLAQGILESGWGGSVLASKGKNLFGIKANGSWSGETMVLPTREFFGGKWVTINAKWRVYDTWEDSIRDHAKFFFDNPRYKPALSVSTDAEKFANAIQQCGYATDPQYAEKLMTIVRGRNLTQFDVPKEKWALLNWAIYPKNA